MPCKLCSSRGQTWSGDPPVCAFDGDFAANWKCATLELIRALCYEGQDGGFPAGVQYRYANDQKYATVDISRMNDAVTPWWGEAVYVSWYKSRGRTDAVWVMNGKELPRLATEAEVVAVADHYKAKGWKNDPRDQPRRMSVDEVVDKVLSLGPDVFDFVSAREGEVKFRIDMPAEGVTDKTVADAVDKIRPALASLGLVVADIDIEDDSIVGLVEQADAV